MNDASPHEHVNVELRKRRKRRRGIHQDGWRVASLGDCGCNIRGTRRARWRHDSRTSSMTGSRGDMRVGTVKENRNETTKD